MHSQDWLQSFPVEQPLGFAYGELSFLFVSSFMVCINIVLRVLASRSNIALSVLEQYWYHRVYLQRIETWLDLLLI